MYATLQQRIRFLCDRDVVVLRHIETTWYVLQYVRPAGSGGVGETHWLWVVQGRWRSIVVVILRDLADAISWSWESGEGLLGCFLVEW